MKLIALKKIGRYRKGDTFELSDRHAKPFLRGRLAVAADAVPAPDPAPAPVAVAAAAPPPASPATPRRSYRRRDLTPDA